jgi:hypothetical protein
MREPPSVTKVSLTVASAGHSPLEGMTSEIGTTGDGTTGDGSLVSTNGAFTVHDLL